MLACYGMLNPKKYDHLAAEYLSMQAHSHSHAEQIYPARF